MKIVLVTTTILIFPYGRRGRDRTWKLDLQLPVQSVPTTSKAVSSNPVHMWLDEHHDITEILLKVVLSTINQPFLFCSFIFILGSLQKKIAQITKCQPVFFISFHFE